MHRRVLLIFLALLLGEIPLVGQIVRCTVSVDSSISSYIREWTDADAVRVTTVNTTDSALHVVIETTVALDGHVIATTAHGVRDRFMLAPHEERVFHCYELLPLRTTYFTDRVRMDRSTGRILVRGDLRICVALLDTATVRSYAKPICIQRSVIPYTQSTLLQPSMSSTVASSSTVAFRWTSVQPLPRQAAYRLRVYACDSAQFLAQAVRTNEPVVDTTLLNQTEYLWTPPSNVHDVRYAWHVFCSNGKGMEYGTTTGYSEPAEFVLRASKKTPKRKQLVPAKKPARSINTKR